MMLSVKPYLRSIEFLRDKVESFNEHPFNIPLISELDFIDFHPDVTFFVGENGVGKSTIIESIAVALGFNAEGGNKNVNFTTKNTTSKLHRYLKLVKGYKKPKDGYFLRAESLYNVASYMDSIIPAQAQGFGGKSLHTRSHGEAFLSVISDKFHGNGLYILDEPEAALSPSRLLTVLSIINDLVEANSQFIIATHSPILLAYPKAKIYQMYDSGLEEVQYVDTEHYVITKNFLNRHEAMLKELLSD